MHLEYIDRHMRDPPTEVVIDDDIIHNDSVEQKELVPMQQGKEEGGDHLSHGELMCEPWYITTEYDVKEYVSIAAVGTTEPELYAAVLPKRVTRYVHAAHKNYSVLLMCIWDSFHKRMFINLFRVQNIITRLY